jgi:ribokinase
VKPKIVVVGSSNTDMIMRLPCLPKPGETVLGGKFSTAAGGKGANQAVAAARAGGDVSFISKVGDDVFGKKAIEGYQKEGMNVTHVATDREEPSGIAMIVVDARGENSIAVASGANMQITPSDVERARTEIQSADVLLMQLEIPVETAAAATQIAHASHVPVILNPAPAQKLGPELLKHISVITPNESEAESLTGVEVRDAKGVAQAARALRTLGVATVIITLGGKGAYVDDGQLSQIVPGFNVNAIDTTAAGDVFSGVLAVALAEKKNLLDAVRIANAAAAISVTKLGAQPSVPTRDEIESLLQRRSATPASRSTSFIESK